MPLHSDRVSPRYPPFPERGGGSAGEGSQAKRDGGPSQKRRSTAARREAARLAWSDLCASVRRQPLQSAGELDCRNRLGRRLARGVDVRGAALQFGVSIVLARLLTPTDFGTVTLVAVVVGIANMLAFLGVGPALVRRRTLTLAGFKLPSTCSVRNRRSPERSGTHAAASPAQEEPMLGDHRYARHSSRGRPAPFRCLTAARVPRL